MDMGAYAQIETLEQIAKENGIEVPRLRGYRLMKNEEPVSKEEIENMFQSAAVNACEDLCTSEPFWNPNAICNSFCTETDRKRDYYLTKAKDEDGYEYHNGIRWDRIHGKKRKILKHEIKKAKLCRALLDTTISGVAFDMLKTVDMVGDTVVWASSGFCGKKQPMPVGMGGPAVKLKINVGGR